ncbi:hypothetical protein FKR81_34650 [Lentzea tibetensis]|uniref:Uncharacterized protein n=1 Tax=Lentzea tibetensis TaxID=2591470 RepID=A0A563EJ18_9PSEU|nr:hypothetical protein [Lentzea tibetensis]TWP46729.1 hypothetical protein FKR81_34650 [Lentzea tibetensis]
MDRNRISGHLWGNAVQAQEIHGDVTFNVKHRWWLTALAVVIAVGAATVAGYFLNRGTAGVPVAGPPAPKLVSKAAYYGCGWQYHDGDPAKADVARVAAGKDPTLVFQQSSLLTFDLYVQNPSAQEILLTDLKVETVRRGDVPTTGFMANSGLCGSALEPRYFEADVLKEQVTPKQGEDGSPAVDFPFKVSAGDPELLRTHFADVTGLVEFVVVLAIVVEGRDYEIRLDNGGQHYKVIGPTTLPRYQVNDEADRLLPDG